MTYNGLGTRMTSSAFGITTQYASDGQLPLTISSGSNFTTVLYGLGPVAEKMDEWNFVQTDGFNLPRQLTDMDGEVTMSVRYNPWGKPIETSGIGNFDSSFIGTLIDATTGLIYVGNGQYYDPETGRFLTRNVNPNGTNPYVPFNPTGLLIAPLGLAAMYYGSRKSRKSAPYVMMLVLMVILPVSIGLACGTATPAPAPAPITPEVNPAPTQTPPPASTPAPTNTAPAPVVESPTVTPCPYCASWAGGNGVYIRDEAIRFARDNKVNYQDTTIPIFNPTDCTNFISYALRAGGLLETAAWAPGSGTWINTPMIFEFLKNAGFTQSPIFTSSANVFTEDTTDVYPLRKHDSVTAGQQLLNELWSDYMITIQNAKPGDLVFYKNESSFDGGWSHVGIITEGWQAPTHYSFTEVLDTEVNEPQIIDHSGKTETDDTLPRSIGDTDSLFNKQIVVLYGP